MEVRIVFLCSQFHRQADGGQAFAVDETVSWNCLDFAEYHDGGQITSDKGASPIFVSLSGQLIEASPWQWEKASLPISLSFSGRERDFSLMQKVKAPPPIMATFWGMLIVASLRHPKNVFPLISVTFSRRETVIMSKQKAQDAFPSSVMPLSS